MAYTAAVPQANQQINQTQAPILANFQAINTWVQVNHIGFDIADSGKHKYVTFPATALGAPTTVAGEISLYSALLAGTNELYLRNSDQEDTPITKSEHITNGYTYLPSGIMIKWGEVTIVGGSFGAIAFPEPFPTSCFSVVLQHRTGGGSNNFQSIQSGSLSQNGFNARSYTRDGGSESSNAFYIAIGN